MKRTFVLLLSILLIAGLSMISCQKKEPSTSEKAATETTGYGEQAVEAVEEAVDTAAGYGEEAGEAVEEASDTAAGYGEKAGDEAGKAIEGLGK